MYSTYYKLLKVTWTLITFRISSLWGSLLSGGCYFWGFVSFYFWRAKNIIWYWCWQALSPKWEMEIRNKTLFVQKRDKICHSSFMVSSSLQVLSVVGMSCSSFSQRSFLSPLTPFFTVISQEQGISIPLPCTHTPSGVLLLWPGMQNDILVLFCSNGLCRTLANLNQVHGLPVNQLHHVRRHLCLLTLPLLCDVNDLLKVPEGHYFPVTPKHRPRRVQTADCRPCRPCRRSTFFLTLDSHFLLIVTK